jgi:hypothetical protein
MVRNDAEPKKQNQDYYMERNTSDELLWPQLAMYKDKVVSSIEPHPAARDVTRQWSKKKHHKRANDFAMDCPQPEKMVRAHCPKHLRRRIQHIDKFFGHAILTPFAFKAPGLFE